MVVDTSNNSNTKAPRALDEGRSVINTVSSNKTRGGTAPIQQHQGRQSRDRFAAIQEKINQMSVMMETMQKGHEDELNALRFYQADELNAMTFPENINRGQSAICDDQPCCRQRVDCVKSGYRNERFGSTTSATCDEVDTLPTKTRTAANPASDEPLVLRKEEATFKQTDESTGKTTHVATTPLNLLVFSTTRVCTHEFRVPPQLVYPVMLGKDLFSEQGIDLLFSSKVEISVAEDCGPVDYDNMIDARNPTHDDVLLLLAFVKEFHDVASGRLGEIKGEPYELPLPHEAKPFACRAFPVPHIHLAKQEIQKLVKLGVMSPDNSSPWASPAFTILKKDGSIRLLRDFRRRNRTFSSREKVFFSLNGQAFVRHDQASTIRRASLPRGKIGLILAAHWANQVYRRFFPMPVIPEMLRKFQRCKFISVFDGKFVFNRLPMGVSTTTDEFQAVMNDTLGDLEFVGFVNDSSAQVETVHGQRVLPGGPSGIQPLQDNVAAIQSIAVPRTRRQLRRFIGMANYYRDMGPRRAHILAPLTALMSPQDNDGAYVITQHIRPLAFWGKKCNESQRKYPANLLELLCILLLLREYRAMFLVQELHIYTDHLNLTYGTFNNIQMTRWRLEVKAFGPRRHYIKTTSSRTRWRGCLAKRDPTWGRVKRLPK
ncbi:hypothetical protein PHYSODRAFT_330301 [Phytophthora sojae]|uniref:Reverse transcriptase RNase H-like domain-containing protein n=1 Tax=Phytophthora sojae (strain P6497) TaxID=1094619 RepID=G4Z7Z4_PHYSP|nr:hypothetical protein PHYSODRAFT_330301 [Phytophthora sojae]EGZ22529.1 hypothetical protein PHYSODRAFT_330301 [Phytophthora sojae]|eukprot:XP_009525246.1 hypothetical protein PHYSODRAFT_330301 [Phytophthora sojae]